MCVPLMGYDEFVAQPFAEASPAGWNLAHTSWIAAVMIRLHRPDLWTQHDEQYGAVLNSYYASLGNRIAQKDRGRLARFDLEELFAYRRSVDERLGRLIEETDHAHWEAVLADLMIVLHHEEQHRELFYTETLDRRWRVPEFRHPYADIDLPQIAPSPFRWTGIAAFVGTFGNVEGGFGWDNENVHKRYVEEFQIANRLVTNQEYLEFMLAGDGACCEPNYLSDGWAWSRQGKTRAPAYWRKRDGRWRQWTLRGWQDLNPDSPVSFVSYYQADAYARWKSRQGQEWRGSRLLTEFEWELACRSHLSDMESDPASYLESGVLQPLASGGSGLVQMLGSTWQWTSSHYEAYPGFVPYEGPFSEYNGKFMNNKRVLRGGSCLCTSWHVHPGYRNFWRPETRFQCTGIRLGRN